MRSKLRYFTHLIIFISSLFVFQSHTPPAEGMFPLTMLSQLDLQEAGLEISAEDIYNPDGVSLVDAMVKLRGCTGSFVSPDGLILTNHHCAFGYLQRASTLENNYLENGFIAETLEDEIPAEGQTCSIIESYEDVSDIILDAVEDVELTERAEVIRKTISDLEAEVEAENPGIKADVSEMFVGQTYILFKYKVLEDVRLVYAPPLSIGNFGGERDNWVWPRHTGDFTFMRAYVAPDGSPAPYSEDNVPYNPVKHLQVNPNGANEEDFIFILGYPGRTFRHRTSWFVELDEKYQLPYIANLFTDVIDKLEDMSRKDPEFGLEYASIVKSLSNVMKNYKGKILGMNRLRLVDKKQEEEAQLQAFINADPGLKEKYGTLLSEISNAYQPGYELGFKSPMTRIFRWLNRSLVMTNLLLDYTDEMAKPEEERSEDFDPNKTMAQANAYFNYLDPVVEKLAVKMIFKDALKKESLQDLKAMDFFAVDDPEARIDEYVDNAYESSALLKLDSYIMLFEKTPEEIKNLNDPLIELNRAMINDIDNVMQMQEKMESDLNPLRTQYLEVKKQWLKKDFVPDANSTLRLTYGYVRGYSPVDATYYEPFTTLSGVIEKAYTNYEEYTIPEKLHELYKEKDYGRFKDDELGDLPIALLYNLDTSGGSSGSPILNSKGELIGLNFDRAYHATINDYAWSESYSRSIGVDVRYILWLAWKIGGTDRLLNEMGIEL